MKEDDQDNDELINALWAGISGLPLEQQEEAILNLFSSAFHAMSINSLEQVKAEITADFDQSHPLVESTLNLIEGHMALRKLNP